VTKVATVAEMTVRDLMRRRGVLALMLALPLTLYLLRRDAHPGQSIRLVCLGLSWAVSTAGLFIAAAARGLDARLRLSGYRGRDLCVGRLVALWLLGLVLTVPFLGLVAVDHPWMRLGAIALAMGFCVTVGAPFGLLIGAALPREMEGTLLLLIAVTMQMIVDPTDAVTRLMPLWSARELGIYAIDKADPGYLTRGLAHGFAMTAGFALLVGAVTAVHLRRRPHVRPVSVG
jgi:hypothetical protein